MRADNAGERWRFDALMSLAGRNTLTARTTSHIGYHGTLMRRQLFYGEVVITPAISVMSAIEGTEIVAPRLDSPGLSRFPLLC